MTSSPFKLSATLIGHSQDVKSVKFYKPDTILSCARDTTTQVWKKKQQAAADEKNQWTSERVFQNATPGFLNAVEAISLDGKEYVVSAGQDSLIQLWPLDPDPNQSYNPQFVLAGHTSNVCCLNVCNSGRDNEPTIFSGSWDCSAIIWRNNLSVYTLRGHSAAVWDVIGLGDSTDSTLTAGADNLIMLWKNGQQDFTFKGHTQAVRALVKLPQTPHLFASAGNDATVRIWSLDGQAVRVMDGHDSFIYSMCCLPSGEIVSSGEDRTVRIWDPNSGQLTQTVTIPAISVWTVSACLATGDIACGSSDNMIRVFTRASDRLASPSDLAKFEESVRASSVPSATVGDIKKSDLPSVSVLLSRRGKKEGEVAMAKNESNGAVEAYQWDGTKGDWTMVGTVVDGIGSSRKQLFDGREYDYVFDVDIKDGVPPLKLPYNASENPYTVAQKWLAKHELPDTYVDQIVEFIDKNTTGVALGGPTSGADPFTGGASYRPGSTQSANLSSTGADPFTGAGSYRPGNVAPTPTAFQEANNKTSTSLIPHRSFLTFPPTNSNFSPVMGKIQDFNSELVSSGSSPGLTPDEFQALEALSPHFSKLAGIPSEAGIKVLEKMMTTWPVSKQFPAIDIVRTFAVYCLPSQILPVLLSKIEEFNSEEGAEINFTLALRGLNNGLSSCPAEADVSTMIDKKSLANQICGFLTPQSLSRFKMTTKNSKVALATLLLNLSIVCFEGALEQRVSVQLLTLTSQFIKTEPDEEALYRSLIGLGNLTLYQKNCSMLADAAKSSIKTVLSSLKGGSVGPNRLTNVIKELNRLVE